MARSLKKENSNSEAQDFRYNIQQIYLEISRTISSSAFIKLYKKRGEPDRLNEEASIIFAGTAISITFAYAALEAFCNSHLHSKFKEISPQKNQSGWQWVFRDSEYKKYFDDDATFEELIEKKDLKEKLKALASACNIPSLHEISKNRRLWNQLCQIVEDIRHFIIHPKPYPDTFNKKMTKIMEEYKVGQYFKIVEEVMKYFYEKTKTRPPEWLNRNMLFRFLGSNDLTKERPAKATSRQKREEAKERTE